MPSELSRACCISSIVIGRFGARATRPSNSVRHSSLTAAVSPYSVYRRTVVTICIHTAIIKDESGHEGRKPLDSEDQRRPPQFITPTHAPLQHKHTHTRARARALDAHAYVKGVVAGLGGGGQRRIANLHDHAQWYPPARRSGNLPMSGRQERKYRDRRVHTAILPPTDTRREDASPHFHSKGHTRAHTSNTGG